MNKKYLKKLTKAQLIRLLLKQEKIDKLKSQAMVLSRWLTSIRHNSTPRTIQRCIQANSTTENWKMENVKPKPVPRKSVKQMVYENLIIPPPEEFRDKYRLIPKPGTDRPLQIRENQNARRPPKPQRSPPPPKKELEDPVIPPLQFRDDKPLQEPDSITDKPSLKIKEELNRALKGHAKSYEIEIQDNLNPLNHFTKTKYWSNRI